jgi:hypothetical protein
MRALTPILLSAALTVFVSPAAGQASTGDYQPANRAEADLAGRADKEIYPQNVRDSLTRFTSVLIVWPGIVRRIASSASGDSITLVLEHHYFDWKEDHGCQRELYFVSPRGEGLFALTIPPVAARAPGFTGKPTIGALVIAYGMPTSVDTLEGQPSIAVSARGLNIIEPRWYRTDAFSYGRGFSDFQLLKVPECSH